MCWVYLIIAFIVGVMFGMTMMSAVMISRDD